MIYVQTGKAKQLEIPLLVSPGSQPELSSSFLTLISLEALYECYSQPAFGLALRMLENSQAAEDTVHEAFLQLCKKPDSFDPQRDRFGSWFLTVVHHLCIDQLKSKRRFSISLDQPEVKENLCIATTFSVDIEEQSYLNSQRSAVHSALSGLSVEQRRAIEMAYFKGMTHQQIAEHTGEPLGTIKSRIRQSLLKLRSLMTVSRLEVSI